jgi:hypothetical protein
MSHTVWPARVGVMLLSATSVGALALPAEAATTGVVSITSKTTVQYKTAAGKKTDTMGMFFGSTDVDIWRMSIEIDDGDPIRVVEIVRRTDPAAIPAGVRQVFYDADTAQGALTRIGGQDGEAIRFLLTAERIAPQHVRTSDRGRLDHPDPARPIPPPSRWHRTARPGRTHAGHLTSVHLWVKLQHSEPEPERV